MGFNINEKINTELHYKDVSLITVALSIYLNEGGDKIDKEVSDRAKRLIDRLGYELYDCPQDEHNGH
ncbi:hypothetical protein [Pedobacter zeae]|uniref:Uncharacterized protein n=1 Tax=Pedobacter zeae TaxID=1737356 RepID=A0A7W6KBA2_9SPHI|nr:hypothetical protein [Pedobacter zeae]MBB4107701.1 hypothetical protein [Pedobacter zeae]GGG97626.1 hypothetical protein GCM10007422_09510 [Pedobacter zeae]